MKKAFLAARPLLGCLLLSLLTGFGCKEKPSAQEGQHKEGSATALSESLQNGAKKVGNGLGKAYDQTKTAVKDGTEAVKDGAKKVGDTITTTAEKAGGAVKTGLNKAEESFDKAAERVKEVGK